MASTKDEQATPVTKIIYLNISEEHRLVDDGGSWSNVLGILQAGHGFQRLYWGRSLELPERVQLHIVRTTLDQHKDFMNSTMEKEFGWALRRLTDEQPEYRYAELKSWSPSEQSLARGAPFTGTAIYLDTTEAWHEGAWPLWTHVVRDVDGCLGGCGGRLLEPFETVPGPVGSEGEKVKHDNGAIVFVGWESTEKHKAYHHTQHFLAHRIILRCGNEGFAGHVVFEGSREGGARGTDVQSLVDISG